MDLLEILPWILVAFFALLTIIFLVLWLTAPSTDTCQDQAKLNPYALQLTCADGNVPSLEATNVTLNYCVSNAPSFQFVQSLYLCGQANTPTDPNYEYFHSTDANNNVLIDSYADWYQQTYFPRCGGGWTLDSSGNPPSKTLSKATDTVGSYITACQQNTIST